MDLKLRNRATWIWHSIRLLLSELSSIEISGKMWWNRNSIIYDFKVKHLVKFPRKHSQSKPPEQSQVRVIKSCYQNASSQILQAFCYRKFSFVTFNKLKTEPISWWQVSSSSVDFKAEVVASNALWAHQQLQVFQTIHRDSRSNKEERTNVNFQTMRIQLSKLSVSSRFVYAN